MTKKNTKYEITTQGKILAVATILGIIYGISLIFSTSTTANSSNNKNVTRNKKITSTSNKITQRKTTNRQQKKTTPPNPKVIKYKEAQNKSAYVRKHHNIDVVKNSNYSQMAPLKKPSNSQEKWVIERIKKYQKDLPRILLEDYGDEGYYINTLGRDALGRYIIPGINPDGQWSTILYSNTNRQGKRLKMILGHNWGKWKNQQFYIHTIYVSSKAISLRSKTGKSLASSIYPVNQSLSKGPVYRFD
ncbi:hypothetical protein [Candidatus Uabimicrobium sp. HlEnr_7]|uniref:hypothetical protein n=1 Tax=Candidatus Uabimicrobium helgolandensis TaxID=3095367 RepID=UPI0035565DDA